MFSEDNLFNAQDLSAVEQFGEHIPGPFFIYRADESEELLYANQAVCELFGCDSLEAFKAYTGFTFRGMVHPEDYARVAVSIERQIRESPSNMDFAEYRIIRRDGETRWIADHGHYVETDDHQGVYYVYLADITHRRLENESDRALRSAVIEALTRVYDSVWLIHDVNTQRFELFRIDREMEHLMPAHTAVKIERFSDAFAFYSRLVMEEDRQAFLDAVTPENIVKNTENRQTYSVPFRRVFEDGVRYYRLEFARLELVGMENGIVAGFKNVDEEIRREREIQHTLSLRSAVIDALTRVYDSVWLINDLESQRFELYRVDEHLADVKNVEAARKCARFTDAFAFYAKLVVEEDRQRFIEAVTPENIARNIADSGFYSVLYRRNHESGARYYRLVFGRLDIGDGASEIVVGFRNVDQEIRRDQEMQQSLNLRSAVVEALTKTYDSVWLINDIRTEQFELFRIDKEMEHLMPANVAVKIKKFSQALTFYSKLVLEEDRQRFLDAVTPEQIVRNTADQPIYSVPFRRVFEDGIRYYRIEFARLNLPDGDTGIVTGFKNVDAEVRKDQEIQRALALRSSVIEALTRAYDSVWLIDDIETQRFELYRIDEKMVHLMPAQEAVKITRFSDAFAFYSKLVLEEDRQAFLDAVSVENIVKNTNDRLIYSVPFRRVFEDGVRYYRVEFAKLDIGEIVIGFKDVDDEVRKEQQIQQALRDAIDAANASNKAKSDFLSSMSHDMRTPMNGIIGMTTIATNHLDDRERVADCLRKINDSSVHLLALINDVLDMNKIESGKVELHEEEFNLADLIDTMLTMTRPQMQAHEHSFRVNIVNVDHEQLIGDSRRIEQVFVNIMSNAIKYTPNGGKISLSVRETPTHRQGFGHYQFIFEDNGYGMTEEFLKHLFEPFARANDKQTAGIQGTGLGMAITRNIVRMMGGDIEVESEYGVGSKFTVNIYLKLQSRQEIDYASFRDLHVLVADDDPVCSESTCEMLGDMGMNSEWVLSGKAAVDRVKTRMEQGRDFYAVIIDWKLPDQGGVETTRQIREMVGGDVPIILFSAYDWTDIEPEARAAGANAFISKPLFRTKLANLFNALINKQNGAEDLEAPLRSLEEMNLNGKHILLAEDQELNAEIATDFLEMTGAEVEWAQDGAQAVEMLAASPDGYYSIIFMDMQMPNKNGLEATEAIRAMDRAYAKKVPIVAMTANAFAEDVQRCKKAGMNEHITKPIDVEILAHVLATYVK